MIKKHTLLIALCLIMISIGISQEDKSTKITIFKPGSNAPSTASDEPLKKEDIHCIKWNYSLLGRGVFLMNYEQKFHKYFSAEVGLGLTYRDYIFEMTHDYYSNTDANNAKFGFALEGGIRLYPKKFDNFEGFFVSPIISYRTYSVSFNPSANSSSTYGTPAYSGSSFKPGYNLLDFQFKIGYSYESLWDDDLLGEFYVGVALRKATMRYYGETTNSATGAYQYIKTTQDITVPQFIIGLKFGVPF